MAKIVRLCKSFPSVQYAVNDKFFVAKLQFLNFVASLVKPFLTVYQFDWPVLPFMYGNLINMVRKLRQLFMKLDVLNKCTSGTALKKLDLTNQILLNQMKLSIGFAIERSCNRCKSF